MRFVLTSIILFSFWIIWSGKFDIFHLALGVVSTLIVSLWSGHLLVEDKKVSLWSWLVAWFRFELYSIWLVWEIVKANVHVIYVAFHPNMTQLISSEMVTFKSPLKKEMPQFLLAQSITLTPGTVTVRVKNGEFLVHALTTKAAKEVPGDMLLRIQAIFGKRS